MGCVVGLFFYIIGELIETLTDDIINIKSRLTELEKDRQKYTLEEVSKMTKKQYIRNREKILKSLNTGLPTSTDYDGSGA
jgi:hypothetical protein